MPDVSFSKLKFQPIGTTKTVPPNQYEKCAYLLISVVRLCIELLAILKSDDVLRPAIG